MFYPDLRFFNSIAAAASGSDDPPMLVVVLTGISLVFAILVILWLLLLLEGKIFESLDAKKAQQKQTASAAAPAAPAPVATPAPAAPVAPGGIQPEVVAAISAAVASVEGEGATVRSIRPATRAVAPGVQMPSTNRGSWGQAGVVNYTEPF